MQRLTQEPQPTGVIFEMALAIPGAWLVQFKNATHHLIFEAPAEFSRIVLDFLDINETVEVK